MGDSVWVAIVTAVVGPAILVLLYWLRDQRSVTEKSKRAAVSSDVELATATLTWAKLLQDRVDALERSHSQLMGRLRELEAENRKLHKRNAVLMHHIRTLTDQVIASGGVPAELPPED